MSDQNPYVPEHLRDAQLADRSTQELIYQDTLRAVEAQLRTRYDHRKPRSDGQFGFSYLLDMYEIEPAICDNLELVYRFLEELVPAIGMTAFTPPHVYHGPRHPETGEELYPDKAGVSGCVFLIESGIMIHTCAPTKFITLDVYSCKPFDSAIVLNAARKAFGFTHNYDHAFLPRGCRYSPARRAHFLPGESNDEKARD